MDQKIAPVFPASVLAAGIAWIVFGSVILANLIVVLVLTLDLVSGPWEAINSALARGGYAAIFPGLVGAFFIYEGIQCVRGQAPDTVPLATGSILFALLLLGVGIYQADDDKWVQAGLSFVCGIGLLAAGVLAWAGRKGYEAWRNATRKKGTG